TMFGYYHPDAAQVVAQPNAHVRVGDGRNFLLLSSDRYSVITIDPAPPLYSAGTVNLYTREFFELCRDHLDDAGNLCVWIPDNHCLESDFQLILRPFHNVFPHCQVWVSPEGTGYYLIGAHQPLVIRPQRMQATQANPRVTADISEYAVRWSWSVAT